MRMIDRGEADAVIAGGTEAALTGLCIAAFRRMGALSREGVSRPFDAGRDGFVMGEGAAVLVLEREEHARARGAEIFARIAGYGASNDAFHITQPDENGRGAKQAMLATLKDAGAATGDVGYINAHGTSTPFNDKIETLAIKRVGDAAARVLDEVAHRPPARRCRRGGGPRADRGGAPRRAAPDDQLRAAGPRLRPGLRARGASRGTRARARAVELLRIRWPERVPGGG
jgi:hypothetical protein